MRKGLSAMLLDHLVVFDMWWGACLRYHQGGAMMIFLLRKLS